MIFILDWIWISFLCLFVIFGSKGQDFVDLSTFDYRATDHIDMMSVEIVKYYSWKLRVRCTKCLKIDSASIKCYRNKRIEMDIDIELKGNLISFPFNISCTDSYYDRNHGKISDIDISPGVTNLSISWESPSTFVNHYLVIFMERNGSSTSNILRETSYQVNNLKKKSWYQICIASIDNRWTTSLFYCEKALTDFSITGPVTNVTTIPESDKVFISWSRPEYDYDIPQGFIIYLQGRTNQTCRLYIIKRKTDIDPASQYSCVNTETITSSLSSLEIKDLSPNSEFSIEIAPFNMNKKTAKYSLTIKTKEGESGPVQNLKVDPDRDPHKIYISFDAPINPAGIILKYRMRLILKIINNCISRNDVIHEEYTDKLYGYISNSVLKKCTSYLLEVTPLNGWKLNHGMGKTASVSFSYSTDEQSFWTANTLWVSLYSFTISLEGLKEDKCKNVGYIIEIKDEKDHSKCLTRIISSLNCEAFEKKQLLEIQVKSLYLSCRSIEYVTPVEFQTYFTNLDQNRKYNVYYAPIMKYFQVGEVRNISVRTNLAKPDIPSGVSYQLGKLQYIKFFWNKHIESDTIGHSQGYVAYITNKKRGIKISTRISTESVDFSDLEMCSEYCFELLSHNEAGESRLTNELCTLTLASKPERSELKDIQSGYMKSILLRWTYSTSDICQKTYLVEYRVKFLLKRPLQSITNNTNVLLTDLKPNAIYVVRVRAERQIKTLNNENFGEFSYSKEFFTGKLQPNLSYYQHNLDYSNKVLNISWGIEQEMAGSIFMYIIRVKEPTNICMYSVVLEGQFCTEPWCWKNIKEKQNESLKKLLTCATSVNVSMDAEQTSFKYLLTSEKKLTNYFVEIYGINLMGIHLLTKETPGSSFSISISLIVVVVIVILLLFATLTYLKLKRKYKIRVKESYSMNKRNTVEY